MAGSDIQDEFSDAIPIEKLHRFKIMAGEDGEVCFGLLGKDGVLRRFQVDARLLPAVAMEMANLSRAHRFHTDGGKPGEYVPLDMSSPHRLWVNGVLPPYAGSQLKLRRASTMFYDLQDILQLYARRLHVTAEHVATAGTLATWKVKFSEPPPAAIPLLIGDIAHNLRSALDVLTGDLARLKGNDTNQMKFPFAHTQEALEKKLRDEYRDVIGDEASDAILALKPYKGGNILLRGLHDLDIIDKHRLVIPTYVTAWLRFDFGRMVNDQMARDVPGHDPNSFLFYGDDTMNERLLNEGDEITIPVGEDPMKYCSPRAGLAEARFAEDVKDLAFGREPVVATLAKLGHLANEIVRSFQREFPIAP